MLILIFIPDQHQSFGYVFTERFNNSGYADGSTSSFAFWFAILPFGFLLTQYTITGFDACAHLSEETEAASTAAAKGIWQLDLLLGARRLHPAAGRRLRGPERRRRTARQRGVSVEVAPAIFVESLGVNWADFVLFISASAQFFCATSCMTSASG